MTEPKKEPQMFNISVPIQGVNVEELKELKDQILKDQVQWLHESLRKLIPPEDHMFIMREMEKPEDSPVNHPNWERIHWLLVKNGLHLEQIPDVFGLRLRMHDRVVAEFKVQFEDEDGRRIYAVPPGEHEVDPYGDSLWPGKDPGKK